MTTNASAGQKGQKYPRVVTAQTSTKKIANAAVTPAWIATAFAPARRVSTTSTQACTASGKPSAISVHSGQK